MIARFAAILGWAGLLGCGSEVVDAAQQAGSTADGTGGGSAASSSSAGGSSVGGSSADYCPPSYS